MLSIDLLYADDDGDEWEDADAVLHQVLDDLGVEAEVNYFLVESDRQAIEWGFQGSPEFRVNGDYLFPAEGPAGKRLRTYITDEGVLGRPSYNMLYEALQAYL